MNNKQIVFNVPFRGLDDSVIAESLGKELASVLAAGQTEDPLKTIGWALQLVKGGSLSLDLSDVETLRRIVKTNKQITDLFKARVLELLSKSN